MDKHLLFLFFMMLIGIHASASDEIRLVVGTYTGSGSKGIYSYSFNQSTGDAVPLDSLSLTNPSYLTPSRDGRFIYVVSENNDNTAALSAIQFDKATGRMTLLNSQLTGGEDPCYVDVNGQLALTANYSGGSMSVFPILANGRLGARTQLFRGHVGGPDKNRQATAHVHCTRFFGKDNVFVTDFSADQILGFKRIGTKLIPLGVIGKADRDSGSRHLEFSHDGRFVYLISELSGNVTVFHCRKGKLTKRQVIASDTVGARGAADIHLSPDGRYLYSSNRLKADGITIFKVNSKDGTLTRTGYQPTGIHPRNFNITPNGRFLLVACRDSNLIQVFAIDSNTGLLTDMHKDIHLGKPVCVKFI